MKKIILSSLVLLFFSASMIIFQMSCRKEANAGDNNANQLGKIVFVKENATSGAIEFWTANLDGTSQTLIPITLPVNRILGNEVTVTPDGTKLVFQVRDFSNANIGYIYTANIDGSNVMQIVGNGTIHVYYGITAF